MNPHPNIDPLLPGFSDEERGLARVLADSAPAGALSAGMDERILGAARAALAPARPVGTPRRHRRWPVALGLAASVVLATGVAWQLRPLPEPRFVRTVRVADSAPARRAQEAPSYRPAVAAAAANTGAAQARDASAVARPPADPVSPAAAAKAARAPAVIAPVVALPAPPPAVVADAAPGAVTEAAALPAPPAAATDRAPGAVARAVAAAPPAVLPPDAWIDRIRLLRDAGRLAEARADLRAMRLSHPQAPIPTDLRNLAD